MLILFSLFAALGATVSITVLIAWYRGFLPLLMSYLDTVGDIVSGEEIIVHYISLQELLDEYSDEDEEEEDEED